MLIDFFEPLSKGMGNTLGSFDSLDCGSKSQDVQYENTGRLTDDLKARYSEVVKKHDALAAEKLRLQKLLSEKEEKEL